MRVKKVEVEIIEKSPSEFWVYGLATNLFGEFLGLRYCGSLYFSGNRGQWEFKKSLFCLRIGEFTLTKIADKIQELRAKKAQKR